MSLVIRMGGLDVYVDSVSINVYWSCRARQTGQRLLYFTFSSLLKGAPSWLQSLGWQLPEQHEVLGSHLPAPLYPSSTSVQYQPNLLAPGFIEEVILSLISSRGCRWWRTGPTWRRGTRTCGLRTKHPLRTSRNKWRRDSRKLFRYDQG